LELKITPSKTHKPDEIASVLHPQQGCEFEPEVTEAGEGYLETNSVFQQVNNLLFIPNGDTDLSPRLPKQGKAISRQTLFSNR